jgi:flagellar basal-body rod protein FlgC
MSFMHVFDVSGSALNAQTVRLNVTASNMANADTVSSNRDQTYRSRQPIFQTIMDREQKLSGTTSKVQVQGIVESKAPLREEYNPNHPMANEEGYIYKSNVNVVEEMANMMSASQSYRANVEVMNTAKQLLIRTLSMGQ